MEKGKLIFLIIIAIIGLVVLGGFLFFFVLGESCETEVCFLDNLAECKKATYVSQREGNIWKYTIKPSFFPGQEYCTVNVENIFIESNQEIAQAIQDKSMTCKIPDAYAGVFVEIHTKLEFCEGPLKERLQDMLIDRLYTYIIQNIGQIAREVNVG